MIDNTAAEIGADMDIGIDMGLGIVVPVQHPCVHRSLNRISRHQGFVYRISRNTFDISLFIFP